MGQVAPARLGSFVEFLRASLDSLNSAGIALAKDIG
jgi:hypothetical protein